MSYSNRAAVVRFGPAVLLIALPLVLVQVATAADNEVDDRQVDDRQVDDRQVDDGQFGDGQLTHDGRLKLDPVFSPGGDELIYSVSESPVMITLMRIQLPQGQPEPLHKVAATSETQIAFSKDGRHEAFVKQSGVTQVQLVIRDARSGGEYLFDPGGGRNHLANPVIMPNGRRVLFSYPMEGGQQIVSVDMQAGDLQALTRGAAINDWPSISPEGRQIALSSTRDGDFEIYVMDDDGENPRRLTHSAGLDIRPRWSPDGSRIAFTSARDGNYEIYVLDVDGTGLQRVTDHPERDDFATWFPDGRHLAIVAERDGRHDLYRVAVPR